MKTKLIKNIYSIRRGGRNLVSFLKKIKLAEQKLNYEWVDISDRVGLVRDKVVKRLNQALFISLFLGFSIVIYQIGFPKEPFISDLMNNILRQIPRIVMILFFLKWVIDTFIKNPVILTTRETLPEFFGFLILFLFDRFKHTHHFLETTLFLYGLITIYFIIRLLMESSNLKTALLNPSILFAVSFILVIMTGTALLLIPDATHGNIEFVDALFTSTSAVCVTGLATVDVSAKFTGFGHAIILILIQVGGLGLMTFTNFFSLLFKGGMTFRNQLMLQNLIETDKPNSLFSILLKIFTYTIFVEFVGVLLLYFSYDSALFPSTFESVKFSVFHSISAFCNAGFSTLPDGLYNINFRFNYSVQVIIAWLIILGGIGFPVIIELYHSLKVNVINLLRVILFKERFEFQARNFSVHTRMVLSMTFILLAVGMGIYYLTEFNNVLVEHPTLYGKLVQSFFGSVTPRTAGFNTVDMAKLTQATVLIYMLLMWIGASPSSTGGGIKTTTFWIAISNIISLAKGKEKMELFRREIDNLSIRRSYSIVFLSLFIVGLSVFSISIFEPQHNLTEIAFESFSAYGTVGLSLNLTPKLTEMSKYILIITMYIGRVGMFTLVLGVFNKVDNKSYSYPKETVLL